ncbi:phosphoglycerate dehydrogenase [Frigidibacter sp. MR17.14]|uniref:phosphoglycerate dehydrogenase n=1 Tax=Frigidibacter sp. MR17.14 TaxID=3126509 RepID=UPI003012C748
MARILITPRSLTSDPPPALDRLRHAGHEIIFSTPGRTPGEDELIRLVPGIDGWLAGVERVTPGVIAAADRLRVISRNGTGTDSLPMAEIEARGIRVVRAIGANAAGVAELAIGLILAACRHLPDEAMGLRAGGWPRLKGREIEGATVGIVGMGAIGRRVARVMAEMGAEVIAHDPFRPELGPLADRVRYEAFETLLDRAEIVSLHCPMPQDGRALLDAAALDRMVAGAILVNTARAALVDERALVAALGSGRIATYGTDVFDTEPPRPGGLAEHPRVIATSHIGGLTDASVRRATEVAVDNLLVALAAAGATHHAAR